MKEEKRHSLYRAIMFVIIAVLLTFIVTTLVTNDKNILSNKLSSKSTTTQKIDALLATVTELINETYIGDVDEEKLIDGALKGLAESVGDKYTEYYSKEELEEFQAETLGSYVGIGIYIKANTETGYAEVMETIKDTPAEEAGFQAGDKILKVDGVEYKAEDLDTISDKVKGEEGTSVVLTLERQGEVFDITLIRRTIHMNYVSGELLNGNIAYIQISTFDTECTQDFENEYNKLLEQGAKSLIIDLRSNGGGLVDEALKIADLMCEKNANLLIKIDKDGKEEIDKAKTEKKITMPVVVMTDAYTASSSEILAGALKDNGVAKIVGDKTFGKGIIQDLIYLPNGGAIKITSAEYYTPNRNKINEVGIEPDYKIMYDYTNPEVDNQLAKAIEVLNGQ